MLTFELSSYHALRKKKKERLPPLIMQKKCKEAKLSNILKEAFQQSEWIWWHASLLYWPCPIFYSGTVVHKTLHHNHLSVSRKKRRKTDISVQTKTEAETSTEELARHQSCFPGGAAELGSPGQHRSCMSRNASLLHYNPGETAQVGERSEPTQRYL